MIKFIVYDDNLVPMKSTSSSNGFDLKAAYQFDILPGQCVVFPTGTWFNSELRMPVFAYITPRSGFSIKNRVIIPNSPGLIDTDYQDDGSMNSDKEIKVALMNLGDETVEVSQYDRIAQITFFYDSVASEEMIKGVNMRENKEFFPLVKDKTRESGFGSTGK